jgi:hypothetical protein
MDFPWKFWHRPPRSGRRASQDELEHIAVGDPDPTSHPDTVSSYRMCRFEWADVISHALILLWCCTRELGHQCQHLAGTGEWVAAVRRPENHEDGAGQRPERSGCDCRPRTRSRWEAEPISTVPDDLAGRDSTGGGLRTIRRCRLAYQPVNPQSYSRSRSAAAQGPRGPSMSSGDWAARSASAGARSAEASTSRAPASAATASMSCAGRSGSDHCKCTCNARRLTGSS